MDDSTQLTNNDQATDLVEMDEAAVPADARELTSDEPAPIIPAQRAEETTAGMLRDRNGRFSRHGQSEPLPDFVACLAAVPGGLGVELPTSFEFAGVRWTPADAAWDGSPIGFRLATELATPADDSSSEQTATAV